MFARMSRGPRRPAEPPVRPKRWQIGLAAVVGLVGALAPMPAVPLSLDDPAAPVAVDRGGNADALVVETVLRLTREQEKRWSEVTTS